MIEIFLRQIGIEQERVVDEPEIHVGDAPIGIPEAGDEERNQHPRANRQQVAAPIEED